MPTTISLSSQTSVSVRSSRPINSDLIELVPIGLFCGIGLLVSLVAFLSGVQGHSSPYLTSPRAIPRTGSGACERHDVIARVRRPPVGDFATPRRNECNGET